jgi:hypothetical protein
MYYTGAGVKVDYRIAAKWVQRASEEGYARAQLDLGYLYEQGKGVPLDYVSACMWYQLAVTGGEERARSKLESLTRLMTRAQISEAGDKAAQFHRSRATATASTAEAIGSPFSERH